MNVMNGAGKRGRWGGSGGVSKDTSDICRGYIPFYIIRVPHLESG